MDAQQLLSDVQGITELPANGDDEQSSCPYGRTSVDYEDDEQPSCSYDRNSPTGTGDDGDFPGVVVTYDPIHFPNPRENNSPSTSNCDGDEQPIKLYRMRWYVLTVMTALNFLQGYLMLSWTVIAESVEATFGWTPATLSLMQSWIYTTYLISILPFAWCMENKGLRCSVIICAALVLAGSVLRCITTSTPAVTWLAHASHIFIGLSGPVCFTSGPVVSSLWFPPNERATATAIMTIAGFAGAAGCFLVGPMVIDPPLVANHSRHSSPSILNAVKNFTNLDVIKTEILNLRYGECAVCCIIFIAILAHLPSKPPSAPSITASLAKLSFIDGLKSFFRKGNSNFWLVGITYSVTISIYGVWSSLLDVNLRAIGITEIDAGWLGFYGVASGCLAAVLFGRIADIIKGSMKMMCVCLLSGCIISTFFFLLIGDGYIPYSKAGLYTCTILQGICLNAAIPMYFEMAIESSYPVTETVTSGVMTILYNIFPIIFLVIFLIPDVGTRWMNWALYGCLLFCLPLLILFKEQYKRLNLDTHTGIEDKQIQQTDNENQNTDEQLLIA